MGEKGNKFCSSENQFLDFCHQANSHNATQIFLNYQFTSLPFLISHIFKICTHEEQLSGKHPSTLRSPIFSHYPSPLVSWISEIMLIYFIYYPYWFTSTKQQCTPYYDYSHLLLISYCYVLNSQVFTIYLHDDFL